MDKKGYSRNRVEVLATCGIFAAYFEGGMKEERGKMNKQLMVWTVCLGLIGGLSAFAEKAPPKDLVIKACQKRKPPVALPHDLHAKKAKIACKTCHHKGKMEQKCSAAECHAGKANSKRSGCAEMSLKKNPFHISCRGCHQKMKKGPNKCQLCHVKK